MEIFHYDSTRVLIFKIIAVLIPGLIFSMLTVTLSPLLAAGLFIISAFCILYWITPKKVLLAFGVFLVFQSLFVQHTSGLPSRILNHFDELFIILSFLLLIMKRIANGQPFRFQPIGLMLLGITFMGFISSYASQLTSLTVALISYVLLIKGFLIFYLFLNMDFNESEIRDFTKMFLVIGLFIVSTTAINIAFPAQFNKFVGASGLFYRLGMLSAVSIFGHPGGLGTIMSIFTCFSLAFFIIKKEKKFIVLSVIFFLAMIASLRILPTLSIFVAVVSSIFILPLVEKKRAIVIISTIGVTFFLVFADKIIGILSWAISGYITDIDPYKVARDALYLAGFQIAWDYFPFGAGLGTFGGWMSRVYYSPLYYKYGLSRIWGLSPDTGQFINDTFWPHILAELGIIGCIFYLLIFYQFFRYAIKGIKSFDTPYQRAFAVGTCMVLVSSLVGSIKVTIYEMSLWGFLIFGSMGIICSLLRAQEREKQ